MEYDAWQNQEEVAQEAYAYFMRTDPDMRDFLGPIEKGEDPVTGREMRWREAKIGMIRGTKPENMRDVKVYLDPIPHIRLDKGKDLQGWYSGKGDGEIRGKRERPCYTDAVLTEPYGGYCSVGCTFCYINSGHRGYRGSGLASVPLAYGDHVSKQLRSMKTATAGYFSSFTDPFLPLEDYYHNTRAGATAFVNEGLPIFFLTRLKYPSWAIDLLKRSPYSYAQRSINTADEQDWRRLSPGALCLSDIFDELKEISRCGIYVSIQVNPVMAGITTHSDIEDLIGRLAACGVKHVIVKFVEANFPWANAMIERVTKRFGDNRAAAFRELFTENSAGQQKTIQETYRREGHTRYRALATKLGLTYSLCYEYTKLPSGRFISMGPEFITSDQCHGHRVPMFVRQPTSGPFAPLEVCPPSGCLRCADDNGGQSRCGSDILGAAKALRLADLRKDPFGA